LAIYLPIFCNIFGSFDTNYIIFRNVENPFPLHPKKNSKKKFCEGNKEFFKQLFLVIALILVKTEDQS